MPNKESKKAPQIRTHRSRYWLMDLLATLLVGFLAYIAVGLVRQPSFINISLLCFFAYIALRLGYELTFNRGGIPISASSVLERRTIARVLRAEAATKKKSAFTIVDLGSGRGELTRCIARALPNAEVIGIEKSRIAYRQSVFMQRLFGLKNLCYENLSLFSYDCAAADAVVLYLGDGLTKQVGEKLQKELKPGALVLSNEFPLPSDWYKEETIRFYAPFKVQIFKYRHSLKDSHV